MIILMSLYLIVLSYLSVFLCRVLNCQGYVYSLAQILRQENYQVIYTVNQFTIDAAPFFMHIYVVYYSGGGSPLLN